MEIKPSFLSRRGVVMAIALLIGGSSGALLRKYAHEMKIWLSPKRER